MNDIKPTNRQSFFPKERKSVISEKPLTDSNIKTKFNPGFENESTAQNENDAKVEIPQKIKDFSRIKKAVDMAPDASNSQKIAELKHQIENGDYNVDYEALADKMLSKDY